MINKELIIIRKDCLGDIVIRNRNKGRWWVYKEGEWIIIIIGVREIIITITEIISNNCKHKCIISNHNIISQQQQIKTQT